MDSLASEENIWSTPTLAEPTVAVVLQNRVEEKH
jgi:hypothetical protein